MTDTTPSLRILRAPAVVSLTGIHLSALNRLMAAKQFPRPVKLTGKAIGWVEGEVIAWIEGRVAMRDEIEAHEASLPPGARYRLRMQREREADEPQPA
jgi:prophage regulatory protein